MSGRQRTLWKAKRWLREHFPSRYPVRVYFRPIAGREMGLCDFDHEAERFTVTVRDTLNINESLETLIHEWAHVLRDHIPEGPHDDETGHDPVFDALVGVINRAWHAADSCGEN